MRIRIDITTEATRYSESADLLNKDVTLELNDRMEDKPEDFVERVAAEVKRTMRYIYGGSNEGQEPTGE